MKKVISVRENLFKKYVSEDVFRQIVYFDGISSMWEDRVEKYSDCPAVEDGSTYTYSQMNSDISLFRGRLVSAGIKKGDYVGIIMNNSYELIKAFLAVTTLGAVAVMLPVHLDEKTVYGCSMKYRFGHIIYNGFTKDKVNAAKAIRPELDCIDITDNAQKGAPSVKTEKEDPCTVVFTGGTTGKSKGALLSNGAVIAGVVNGCYGYENVFSQRYIIVLPMTHVFGLIRNTLTSLYTGSLLHITKNPKDMFREMAVFNPTILVLVPALAELAINLSRQMGPQIFGRSLKAIICGAAPVPVHLVKEYGQMGVSLFPGYGLTESANLVSGNPEIANKPDSVGLPYPGQEFRIEDGELWIKGINMMEGYVNDPDENQKAYHEGWFKTGDLVRFDDDGFLYIVGRMKDVIVLSTGEKISPEELELEFSVLDYIQDTMVYEKNGELVLEVYPREAEIKKIAADNTEEYIKKDLEKINMSLPSFKRVNKIVVRDRDFDRTPAMKKVRP